MVAILSETLRADSYKLRMDKEAAVTVIPGYADQSDFYAQRRSQQGRSQEPAAARAASSRSAALFSPGRETRAGRVQREMFPHRLY
jgi:hypothetical protein